MRFADLKPNENNLRAEVGNIERLAESIKGVGLLQPLLVREDGTVIAGHRRAAAIKLLIETGAEGWTEDTDIPVQITDRNGSYDTQAMLVENLQREGINPIEEAIGYQRLLDSGMTQREIATTVGVSQPQVSKRVQLLVLPPYAQKALVRGDINVDQAQELTKLKNAPIDIIKKGVDSPAYIPMIVRDWQVAEAYAEIEDAVREIGGTPFRRESEIPKRRGMVAVVQDDNPLTVDYVKDLAEEPEEDLLFLTRVNAGQEGIAYLVEYVSKEDAPEVPKQTDPEAEKRRELSAHRREQFQHMLSTAPKKTEVVDSLLAWFADPSNHSTAIVSGACKTLGLKAVKVPARFGDGEEADWAQTLLDYAGANARQATSALLALLVQEVGAPGQFKHISQSGREVLTTFGYDPHPDER